MEHRLQTSLKSSHHRLRVMAFLIDFLNGAGYVNIKLTKKTFCRFCYDIVNARKPRLNESVIFVLGMYTEISRVCICCLKCMIYLLLILLLLVPLHWQFLKVRCHTATGLVHLFAGKRSILPASNTKLCSGFVCTGRCA